MPPRLQIHDAQVSDYFTDCTEDSAKQLASLINACPPDSLDTIFNPIFQQLYLHSFNQIKPIDSLLHFLTSVANHIDSSVYDGGAEGRYGSTFRRASSGPETLAERLSQSLYETQWDFVSRVVTPDEEYDRKLSLEYYKSAAIYGTFLARAFVVRPDLFRDRLWREVEDVFVKGLFTEDSEPGIYVVIATLLLGAGKDIRAYLDDGHVGKGKSWVWYDDKRFRDEDTWGWTDIAAALEGMHIPDTLPGYVTNSFRLAKDVIRRGQDNEVNWDSNTLAHEGFPWV